MPSVARPTIWRRRRECNGKMGGNVYATKGIRPKLHRKFRHIEWRFCANPICLSSSWPQELAGREFCWQRRRRRRIPGGQQKIPFDIIFLNHLVDPRFGLRKLHIRHSLLMKKAQITLKCWKSCKIKPQASPDSNNQPHWYIWGLRP